MEGELLWLAFVVATAAHFGAVLLGRHSAGAVALLVAAFLLGAAAFAA